VAHVQDLWYIEGPNGGRVPTARHKTGKRWLARWTDPDGTRRSKAFDLKSTADNHLTKVKNDKLTGSYVAPNATTVGDLWPRWEVARSRLAKSTREGYAAAWSRYIKPKWADIPIQSITRAAVQEWLPTLRTKSKVELSASWSRKVHIVLSGLLDLAVDDRLLTSNPLKGMALAKQEPSERRYLTVQEYDALVEAMVPHDLEVRVMVLTGVRRGEMAGLRVGDLDEARGRLRIARDVDSAGDVDSTKTRRHRDVPVGEDLMALLLAAAKGKRRTDLLLPAPGGGPWTRDTWRPKWESARVKAGLDDLDTHELRHTAASLAIHSGANVKTVQRMLGHASAAITLDIYGHLWDDELDALPARMRAHMDAERVNAVQAADKRAANAG
jgi:integrase